MTPSGAVSSRSFCGKAELQKDAKDFPSDIRSSFCFPPSSTSKVAKVRIASANLPWAGDTIAIRWYAKVERALRIGSLRIAEALAPLHILTPEVVRERFGYKDEGLHVAFLRVFEISPSWILQNEKRFAGCRSWVDLPSPPEMKMRPVVDDEAHQRLRAQFDAITVIGRLSLADDFE